MNFTQDDFLISRAAFGISLIGTALTVFFFVYYLMRRKEMNARLERDEAFIAEQKSNWKRLQTSVRNLELANCESSHIMSNPALSTRLGCPTKDMPPKGSLIQPSPNLSPIERPPMNNHQQLLPNLGYFGPFNTVMRY